MSRGFGDRAIPLSVITVDVEDWYHILDDAAAPTIEEWTSLESRVERNVDVILELLENTGVRGTFFWLGWIAERQRKLVGRCRDAGHEIGSHGYAHVLAYEVGPEAFREDVYRAKEILEEITGEPVYGFRAAGFGITDNARWAFKVIREVGHTYDASVFPAPRGHGGMEGTSPGPHLLQTQAGPLLELPMSTVEVLGHRICLFSGGYLRLAPKWLIEWGISRLHAAGQPLVVLVHPREIDPEQPRLLLGLKRRFKCYVNLKSTMPKLEWLCRQHMFCTMGELADSATVQEDLGLQAGS